MNLKKTIKSKIIAHLDGDLSGAELQELFSWIKKSKENARYYTELKDMWEASISNASEIADTGQEWERFLKKIDKRKKQRPSQYKLVLNAWMKVAAILVIGVLIGSIVVKFFDRMDDDTMYFTSVAPQGSVSQMILPDSTIIYLNAGSEIKYKIGENQKKREVFLNGEAWFKVTKIENRPFVVHTNYYDVNVLGTEFNVKTYEADSLVETTLEKGCVFISPSDKFKMSEIVKLLPNEQFVFDKKKRTLEVKKVNTKYFTAWKDNKLIFVNMNLKDLIVILERKYGVDIEVKNKAILNYHYDGSIKNETIIEVLEIIKNTLPIKYKIVGQKIEIESK